MKYQNKKRIIIGLSLGLALPITATAAACGNSQNFDQLGTNNPGNPQGQVDLSSQDKAQIANYYNNVPKSNFVALDSDKLPSQVQAQFQTTASPNDINSKFNNMLGTSSSTIPPLFVTSKQYLFNFSVVSGSVDDRVGRLTVKMVLSENRNGTNVYFKANGDATTNITEAGIQFNVERFASYDKIKSTTQDFFSQLRTNANATASNEFSQKIPSLVTPADLSNIDNFNKVLSVNNKINIPSIMSSLNFTITESNANDTQGTANFRITAKSQNIPDLNASASISVSNFSTQQNQITKALQSIPNTITLTTEDKDYIPENFAYLQNKDPSSLTKFISDTYASTLPNSSNQTKFTYKVSVDLSKYNNDDGTITATIGVSSNNNALNGSNSKSITINNLVTPQQLIEASKNYSDEIHNYLEKNGPNGSNALYANSETVFDKYYDAILKNGNTLDYKTLDGRSHLVLKNQTISTDYYNFISKLINYLPKIKSNNNIINKNFNIFINPFQTFVFNIQNDTNPIGLFVSLYNKIPSQKTNSIFETLNADGKLINLNVNDQKDPNKDNNFGITLYLDYNLSNKDFSKTNNN
ncbi:lipoprotein 17-related variable surface protein [[Mycoplasma] testudinis]|uniref:lipoprotein 17-related variable surface protein n=1 Tax=[Mycoplasma] testudinis TaxID=33924 RepID=UPI000489D1BD|nr:lipoprotein 17-related variable surface protein [[Mycoplasma] testudinis]